jgi:hypothetical protein
MVNKGAKNQQSQVSVYRPVIVKGLILLNLAELEIDSIQVDGKMNWQINLDNCGSRQIPKGCPFSSPP